MWENLDKADTIIIIVIITNEYFQRIYIIVKPHTAINMCPPNRQLIINYNFINKYDINYKIRE